MRPTIILRRSLLIHGVEVPSIDYRGLQISTFQLTYHQLVRRICFNSVTEDYELIKLSVCGCYPSWSFNEFLLIAHIRKNSDKFSNYIS